MHFKQYTYTNTFRALPIQGQHRPKMLFCFYERFVYLFYKRFFHWAVQFFNLFYNAFLHSFKTCVVKVSFIKMCWTKSSK